MFGDESGDESLRFVFGEVERQASEGDVLVLRMPVCDDGGWSRIKLGHGDDVRVFLVVVDAEIYHGGGPPVFSLTSRLTLV